MICPRPDCPIEFTAKALEAYRAENNIPYSAQSETCEHCAMCEGKLVCWERIVRTAKDGTVTVELRLKQTAAA